MNDPTGSAPPINSTSNSPGVSIKNTVVPDSFRAENLNSPEVIKNPYPYYAALRGKPVQFGLRDYPPGTVPGQDEPKPAWVFLKHEDVVKIALDHESFSSRDEMQEGSAASTLMLVNHDRPRHTELRAIAQTAFSPKRVINDIAPWAEKTARELVSKTLSRRISNAPAGNVDVMETLAVELPARFITRLFGTPEEDWHLLRDWANAFMVTADMTPQERNASNQAIAQYYAAAVTDRIARMNQGEEVSDDLMTAFIASSSKGLISVDEVIRFCLTIMVAGAETTVFLLGNLIANFLERPDLYQLLRTDRTKLRPFIEETLRRDGPPQRLFRVATRDCTVGTGEVRQGDWVAIFFAAANRDPSVFENPDKLILDRDNVRRHLTFGHGVHHCMGASIARMEAEKLLAAILDACSAIEPGNGPLVRQDAGLLNYGLKSCPVKFIPAI